MEECSVDRVDHKQDEVAADPLSQRIRLLVQNLNHRRVVLLEEHNSNQNILHQLQTVNCQVYLSHPFHPSHFVDGVAYDAEVKVGEDVQEVDSRRFVGHALYFSGEGC